MAYKIVIFAALATVAIAFPQHGHHEEHHHAPAAYKFEYGVKDPHTHDLKSQQEHLHDKHLDGSYSLHEPDGTIRIVKYRSDPHTGFEAIVERQGHAQHPAHYGKHGEHHGGVGGTSYVSSIHWANQGPEEHHGHH